jgi:hypothetical protein
MEREQHMGRELAYLYKAEHCQDRKHDGGDNQRCIAATLVIHHFLTALRRLVQLCQIFLRTNRGSEPRFEIIVRHRGSEPKRVTDLDMDRLFVPGISPVSGNAREKT